MKYHIWTALLLITFGCGHTTKEAARKKMVGINGEAIYVLNKDGVISSLYKEEYSNSYFSILIDKDTISLGTTFRGRIYPASGNYKIRIFSPTEFNVQSEGKPDSQEYKFTPQTEGIYEFKGQIQVDSIKTPFEYKFIVIK